MENLWQEFISSIIDAVENYAHVQCLSDCMRLYNILYLYSNHQKPFPRGIKAYNLQ